LFTSSNWSCQPVDASVSPPVNGVVAVTPLASAMSRYVGWPGPAASVCSFWSAWLVS